VLLFEFVAVRSLSALIFEIDSCVYYILISKIFMRVNMYKTQLQLQDGGV